jgi:hypothetical protein
MECHTSPALAIRLAQSLDPSADAGTIEALFKGHDGNIREVLRALYDRHGS